MPRLSLSLSLVVAGLVAPALAQAAGESPIAQLTPPSLDPFVNPTVITGDGVNTVQRIHQCEVRHIGAGVYRVAATVRYWDPTMTAANGWTDLLSGTLDLSGSTPVWTPNADLSLINFPGTAIGQFQVSISADGLTVVWDNYVGTTYNTSAGAQTGNTFVCTRASTATPFAIADVRAVTNIAGGGVDPHIGAVVGPNTVELFLIDFIGVPIAGSIIKGMLNTSTGALTGTAAATTWNNTNFPNGFQHSPYVLRDSAGAARVLFYSEYLASGTSSTFFTEAVDDSGTPEMVFDGSQNGPSPTAPAWFNNPGHTGGTLHQMSDGADGEWTMDVTLLANAATDSSGNARLACWVPVQPSQGASDYVSWIGAGDRTPIAIPIPGVAVGQMHTSPVVFFGPISHDQFTGLGERLLTGLPVPLVGISFDCQLATLNIATSQVYLSNTARLDV